LRRGRCGREPALGAVADRTPPYNRAVSGSIDLLVLEGMSFYGYHGETEAERTLGNRFHVDVEIRIDLSIAGRSDDITDTLDYSHAFALIRVVVEEQQYRLIETIAARIAEILLAEPRVSSVRVRVGKQPPIPGAIDRCSVIIERFATAAGEQE
jgi:7,8-dihydroneopterin aldolase/epimerase/oxygenase